MLPPPETIRIKTLRVACDGSGEVEAALGHPRVYLHIDDSGFVDCGYCDRRFVLEGGPADNAAGADPKTSIDR
ncbi:MAG TPA: zinc-finger domain-containing protein [Sphingomicrobium sp.]|nr:zinc-finger domain-containing protein [Sphingomicrobium sp.]